MNPGILYGISVGTGDPELITVKGLRILQNSDIVAFPAGLNNHPGIAEKIIASWLQPQQQLLALKFPYTQDKDALLQAWQQAAHSAWHHLQQGKNIAFACLGDVSFYSTFTYLAQTLQELHPQAQVETVPGVCSPMAIASILQLPLTVNHERLTILPALHQVKELEAALDLAEVVVLLKVSSVYSQVWKILQTRNLLDYAHIVEKATFPEQKIYRDLTKHPHLDLSYFSIMIIRQPATKLSQKQMHN